MEALVIGGAIIVGLLIVWQIGSRLEKRDWNNGKCPRCYKPWVYFDTDSQGGRGYKCGCGNGCWISWWGIDT